MSSFLGRRHLHLHMRQIICSRPTVRPRVKRPQSARLLCDSEAELAVKVGRASGDTVVLAAN